MIAGEVGRTQSGALSPCVNLAGRFAGTNKCASAARWGAREGMSDFSFSVFRPAAKETAEAFRAQLRREN